MSPSGRSRIFERRFAAAGVAGSRARCRTRVRRGAGFGISFAAQRFEHRRGPSGWWIASPLSVRVAVLDHVVQAELERIDAQRAAIMSMCCSHAKKICDFRRRAHVHARRRCSCRRRSSRSHVRHAYGTARVAGVPGQQHVHRLAAARTRRRRRATFEWCASKFRRVDRGSAASCTRCAAPCRCAIRRRTSGRNAPAGRSLSPGNSTGTRRSSCLCRRNRRRSPTAR